MSTNLTIKLDSNLYDMISNSAQRQGLTMSQEIEQKLISVFILPKQRSHKKRTRRSLTAYKGIFLGSSKSDAQLRDEYLNEKYGLWF